MADTDKALKYRIETEADLAAAREAVEQFERLNDETEKAAPTAEETRRALQEMGREMVDVGTKAKGTGRWLNDGVAALNKTAGASAAATKSISTTSAAAGQLGQAVSGLSSGSLAGLISGLRGLVGVVTTLATGALGAVLLPVLGTAAAAFVLLNKRIKENQAQIEAWAKQDKEVAEQAAANQAKITKATTESNEARAAGIAEAVADYGALTSAIDEASARVEALRASEEKLALARVTAREAQAIAAVPAGPDQEARRTQIAEAAEAERARIKGAHETAKAQNALLKTITERDAAEQNLARTTAELEGARRNLAEAEERGADTLIRLTAFREAGGDVNSREGREVIAAAKEALVAKDQAAKEVAALEAAFVEADKTLAARKRAAETAEKIAKTDEEVAALAEETRQQQKRIADTKRREAEAAEIKRLEGEANEAYARGDYAGQDEAVAALRKIQQDQANKATADAAALAKVAQAAKEIPTPPPLDVEPVRVGIIQFGNKIITITNGQQTQINTLTDAVRRLNERVANIQTSSQ